MDELRIGYGADIHRLAPGETLWLGGVLIPYQLGTIAHSDGDVLIHALCDALLGALKLGDIGCLFPDTAPEFKNIGSGILLAKTMKLVKEEGYSIINIDSVIFAQKPKLRPFIGEMEKTLATLLEVDTGRVSIKATTTEKLGFEGREEGITAHVVVLLRKINPPG